MGDWPIGLSTGCFYRMPILDCLAAIRGAGFGRIEVCSFRAHLDYPIAPAVRARSRKKFFATPGKVVATCGATRVALVSIPPTREPADISRLPSQAAVEIPQR